MGDELNLRDLGSVLTALKRDGEKVKATLEKITNTQHRPDIPPPETQALYLNAAALLRQLPKKHPLREQFDTQYIGVLSRLVSDGESRKKFKHVMEVARGAYVKAGRPCCMERIADDIADLLASRGASVTKEDYAFQVANSRLEPLNLRVYCIAEATDDDGAIIKNFTRAYIGWKPGEFGQGEAHLVVLPPFTIKDLNERIEKHNLISLAFVDELYYEYGTPTDHPAYEDIKKGREFLEDFFEPCACPPKKGVALARPDQDPLTAFSKRYALEDDVIEALKHTASAIGSKTSKGWKGMAWYVILPKPLADHFVSHAQHAIRDVLHAHGNPEGIEWKVNGLDYPGGMYINGKDQIPEDKKGSLIIVSCAYDQSKFSTMIYNGNAPPVTALVSDIEQEIDIQDALGLMQVHSIKKPDKDWERCSSSRLLL